MTQMLIYLSGMDVSPCFPPFCGACPYWSEMEIEHESDWGVCEKKIPPDNLTRVYDSCSESVFY